MSDSFPTAGLIYSAITAASLINQRLSQCRERSKRSRLAWGRVIRITTLPARTRTAYNAGNTKGGGWGNQCARHHGGWGPYMTEAVTAREEKANTARRGDHPILRCTAIAPEPSGQSPAGRNRDKSPHRGRTRALLESTRRRHCPATQTSRSSRFKILPVGPFGSSAMTSTIRGYL